jgi:CubicO group peptidase (beta-lactamase class C family)
MHLPLSILILAFSATTNAETAAARNVTLAAAVERAVDEAVAAPLRDRRFSGVVRVEKDNRVLVRKAYGLADRERAIPNTPDTPFMIMSVSKQFTAALIVRLAAQRRLGLHDRVSDYLAGWPLEWDAVTIHDLLTHSAGTDIDTTYFWLVRYHPEYWPDPAETPPEYKPRELVTAPGTTFLYANVGYTLLSMIASAATGRPFDELMRDEVFCPLGMNDTRPERGGPIAGRARGYRRTDDGFAPMEQKTIDIVGAGDLVSTVDDLAKWDRALSDDRFLPSSFRAAMLTPYVTGKYGGVGYSWFFRTGEDGQHLQFHSGDGAGFRAWNYRVPEAGLTIIVLSNIGEHDSSWLTVLRKAITNAIESTASP